MQNKSSQLSKFHLVILLISLCAFLVPLVVYTINGSFMRYSGDDYCYSAVLKENGFWKTQWFSYLNVPTYNADRYSLTLLASIIGLFPPQVTGILPGLAIISWLVGIYLTLTAGMNLFNIELHSLEGWVIAAALVFFTLWMAPNLEQVLYWRSGMLPYLAPLIANTYLLLILLRQIPSSRSNIFILIGIFLLALLAGGFSETAAALQTGIWLFLLAGAFYLVKFKRRFPSTLITPIIVVIAGTLLALVLLALSPTNQIRLAGGAKIPSLFEFLRISIFSAAAFIFYSLKGLIVPNLVLILFFVLISYLISIRQGRPLKRKLTYWLKWISFIGVILFVLVVFCCAPSAYAQKSYPEQRALLTGELILVLAEASFAYIVMNMVRSYVSLNLKMNSTIILISLLLFGLVSLYPLRATRTIWTDTARFQLWATYWDQRDKEIRQLRSNGVLDVEVVHLDRIMDHVGELSADPDFWYNNCAERYYGVNSIRADIPIGQ